MTLDWILLHELKMSQNQVLSVQKCTYLKISKTCNLTSTMETSLHSKLCREEYGLLGSKTSPVRDSALPWLAFTLGWFLYVLKLCHNSCSKRL